MANTPFSLSSAQRKGVILLAIILIVIILTWQLFKHLYKDELQYKSGVVDLPTSSEIVQAIEVENTEGAAKYSPSYDGKNSYVASSDDAALRNIKHVPQPFDPNTSPIEMMVAAGVPIYTAKRIVKYRNKGGIFYEKEKLKNFGLSPEQYEALSPYITISATRKSYSNTYKNNDYEDRKSNTYTPKSEPTNVDINTATQEELMLFKGIGPGYSKRIIEFRNSLGGYHSVSQLKEVYGLPDSTYNHIKDRLVVNAAQLKKININTATLEMLSAHPYIRKYMAEQILKFRNDIGKFKSLQELKQIPLINEEKYRKIVPYIYIE